MAMLITSRDDIIAEINDAMSGSSFGYYQASIFSTSSITYFIIVALEMGFPSPKDERKLRIGHLPNYSF